MFVCYDILNRMISFMIWQIFISGMKESIHHSTQSSNSSQSTSQAESQPAQEAPAASADQPYEVDENGVVWKTDGPIEPGETLTPDNWICSWCNVDCISYDGYVEHIKTVHNMQ